MRFKLAIAASLSFGPLCNGLEPEASPAAPALDIDFLRSREVVIDSSAFAAKVGRVPRIRFPQSATSRPAVVPKSP